MSSKERKENVNKKEPKVKLDWKMQNLRCPFPLVTRAVTAVMKKLMWKEIEG